MAEIVFNNKLRWPWLLQNEAIDGLVIHGWSTDEVKTTHVTFAMRFQTRLNLKIKICIG